MKKQCSKCERFLELEAFPRRTQERLLKPLTRKSTLFKRKAACKECLNKLSRAYYQDNVEVEKPKRKIWYEANKEHVSKQGKLKRAKQTAEEKLAKRVKKYGLTVEDCLAMLDEQGGGCKCCGDLFIEYNFCVDHNHRNGNVRGLLCHPCNTSLGLQKEDPKRCGQLTAYALKIQED